jgi:hypothetical protein
VNKSGVFPNGSTKEKATATRPVGGPFAGAGRSDPENDIRRADSRLIVAAIGISCAADVLLTIGGAQGGIGYMVSVYDHKQQHRTYAHSIDELHGLLWRVIDYYASTAEDVVSAWGLEGVPR